MKNLTVIRFGAIAAWIAMTVLFSFAAWQVVQATEGETTDAPSAPVVMASGLTTTTTDPNTTTSAIPVETTNASLDTTISATSTTTSSSPTGNGTTQTTEASTQTTPPSQNPNTRVIETEAGTVSVSFAGREVHFRGASPTIGWSVEVDHFGPDEVDVKFERDEESVEVQVEWEDGELQVEISRESEQSESGSDD